MKICFTKCHTPGHASVFTAAIFTKFSQFILRKIIVIVATRCPILRLECTKYNFSRGSRDGELPAVPMPSSWQYRGGTSKGIKEGDLIGSRSNLPPPLFCVSTPLCPCVLPFRVSPAYRPVVRQFYSGIVFVLFRLFPSLFVVSVSLSKLHTALYCFNAAQLEVLSLEVKREYYQNCFIYW